MKRRRRRGSGNIFSNVKNEVIYDQITNQQALPTWRSIIVEAMLWGGLEWWLPLMQGAPQNLHNVTSRMMIGW